MLDISKYIHAGYGIIFIETLEIKRAIKSIDTGKFVKVLWNSEQGITKWNELSESCNPIEIIDKASLAIETAFILENYDEFIDNSAIVQKILNNYDTFKSNQTCLVIIGINSKKIHDTLKGFIPIIEFDYPNTNEINTIITNIVTSAKESAHEDFINNSLSKEKFEAIDFIFDDNIVDACKGMTYEEIENIISYSLITENKLNKEIILQRKRQIAKATGFMDFINPEPIENIGGVTKFKEYIFKRTEPFINSNSIKPKMKAILLAGYSGCLSGDTKLMISTSGRKAGREYTIKDAYYKFNHIPLNNGKGKNCTKFWNSGLIQTLSLKNDNFIGYHEIDNIIYSGKKVTYMIKTKSGKKLRVTKEHPFKVPEGTIGADINSFKQLKDLKIGNKILCRANINDVNKNGRCKKRKNFEGKFYHPYAYKKYTNGYEYNRISYARIIVDAYLNDILINDFIFILKTDLSKAQTLKFLDPREYEVHHIDFDYTNDSIDNLEILSKEDHQRLHGNEAIKYFGNRTIKEEIITKIKKIGIEDTYDIIMKDPFHNYVANNMIVHNTGKSLAGKVVCSMFNWPGIILDVGGLKGGIVGETEKKTRLATKTIDAFGKCVIVIDEIEKMFGGSGKGMKHDTSEMMLGHFLTWMQERQSEGILLATANNLDSLPPEFLRMGRWDAMFFFNLPNPKEIKEIIEIKNRQFKSKIPFDSEFCEQLWKDKWSGAEIEQLAKDIHYEDSLEDAMNSVPILAQYRSEELNKMKEKTAYFRKANEEHASIKEKLFVKKALINKRKLSMN